MIAYLRKYADNNYMEGHHHHSPWERITHALIPHSHDHADMISDSDEASAVAMRAAWMSLAGMGVTALLQIAIVWISGSVGLLADTIHNLGHLITTIPLIIAFKLGRRPASTSFTYGLRRAEDLVGLFIGLVIAASAALIFVDAWSALRHPRPMSHIGWVLAAAIIGAIGNELVAQYRIRAGRRVGSAALIAEGQHARTDAMTSLAVIIGAVGAMLGFAQLDAVVGLFIGVMVVGVLISSMKSVVRRLLDGIDPHLIEEATQLASRRLPVKDVRARWLGHELVMEVLADIPATMTLAELRAIESDVKQDIKQRVPRLEELRVVAV